MFDNMIDTQLKLNMLYFTFDMKKLGKIATYDQAKKTQIIHLNKGFQ
jgi:hypothetical protein